VQTLSFDAFGFRFFNSIAPTELNSPTAGARAALWEEAQGGALLSSAHTHSRTLRQNPTARKMGGEGWW
jgi:hypothetical protein